MMFPRLAGILLWKRLPEQLAAHFGEGNVANGWSSRGFSVSAIIIFAPTGYFFL